MLSADDVIRPVACWPRWSGSSSASNYNAIKVARQCVKFQSASCLPDSENFFLLPSGKDQPGLHNDGRRLCSQVVATLKYYIPVMVDRRAGLVCVPQLLYFPTGCANNAKGQRKCCLQVSVFCVSWQPHFSLVFPEHLSFLVPDSMPGNWRCWENGCFAGSNKWKFPNSQWQEKNSYGIKDNIRYLEWCVFRWSRDSRAN